MLVAKKAAASQHSGRARQQVGRTAAREEAATATAADAERAAFGLLQQNDADERGCDHEVNDEQNGGHDR